MQNLGTKKWSESTQTYSQEDVYGTVNELITKFKAENECDAEFRPKKANNFAGDNKMMMFVIRQKKTRANQKVDNLLCSDDLYLSRAMSDQIRTGELHFTALKDFVVVNHTNNETSLNPGATFPLIVRPSSVDSEKDEEIGNKFAFSDDTDITKAYETPIDDIDDVMNQANL